MSGFLCTFASIIHAITKIVTMNKVYYSTRLDDIDFSITDKYVRFGSEIIPTPALSYISIKKKRVHWWVSILFLIVALIATLIGVQDSYSGDSYLTIALISFVIGLTILIITIIKNRERFFCFVSHSRESIYIKWKWGDYQPLFDAIFQLLEGEGKLVPPDNKNDYSRYMPQ